jgi:hypothetical protein
MASSRIAASRAFSGSSGSLRRNVSKYCCAIELSPAVIVEMFAAIFIYHPFQFTKVLGFWVTSDKRRNRNATKSFGAIFPSVQEILGSLLSPGK